MKVLFDYQTFTLQKYGGISRYFYEIIKYLKNKDSNNIKTSLLFSNNHYISDKKDIKHIKFFEQYNFRGKQRLNILLNKMYSIFILKQLDFDIFHPTYYDTYFLKYINNKPFVVTVYDMIHEKFNDNFSINDKTSQNKKILCEKANKIIAISQSTKNDLMEIFDIEESKIEVVYLANSLTLNESKIKDSELPNRYMLFVGSRGKYKNFIRFVKAVSSILDDDKDLSIVCVGGGEFNEAEKDLFDSLKIEHKILQFNIDDDRLSMFYQYAELFIYSSLYEGFGIPVLEAFACNCPLVCSNISSLSEIAGNGAEYFNPYDEDSIRIVIKKVLYNEQIQKELKNNGKERLKYFSWKKTVENTKKIYESLIK